MDSESVSKNTIDVKLFFAEITRGYSELTTVINHFSQNLSSYKFEQITLECSKIQEKRTKLSRLDEQLFHIVSLTGSEIKNELFVDEYRNAFNNAISACNDLHDHLQLTKAELLSPVSSSQPH